MGTGASARARAAFRGVSLSATDRLKVGFSVFQVAGRRLSRPPAVPAIEAAPDADGHSPGEDRRAVRHNYEIPMTSTA